MYCRANERHRILVPMVVCGRKGMTCSLRIFLKEEGAFERVLSWGKELVVVCCEEFRPVRFTRRAYVEVRQQDYK